MIKLNKALLGAEELAAVEEVFAGGWLGMGSHTLRFEEALKEYLGARNVVAVNTGTSALHLALVGLGIGPGDEVVVPSLTFVASFQAIAATGARPVACESDPETLLLDMDDAERRITDRTKAIMPVHFCGQPCDMDRLLSWREKYGVRIVEDAAHAIGSEYRGRRIGSFGDVTCFSFDPIKNMTCGDGGAVVTDDDALADDVRDRRVLGVERESEARYRNERKWMYNVPMRGYRYHLANIGAAIGLVQLRRLPQFIARRGEICRRYDAAFAGLPGLRTLRVDYDCTAPFMYAVRVPAEQRDAFMAHLRARDVESGIRYPANHLHTAFRDSAQELPVVEQLVQEIVAIPLHPGLTDAEVEQVIDAVRSFSA